MKLQWFAFSCCVWLTFSLQAQENASITRKFADVDSVAFRYRNHSLQNLHLLAYQLTAPFHTEKEKFRSIYRWEGVVNHSWNAVQLDGQWFLCDATWSSGAIDGRTREFLKRYDDAYFLPDPNLFIRNHYPLDTAWILITKRKPTLQQFLNRPVVYRAIFDYKISALTADTIAISVARGQVFKLGFRMDCTRVIENAGLVVSDSNGSSGPVSVELKDDGQGNFHVEPIITSRGSYLLHLLLDDQYAVTYKLTVQ